MLDTLVEGDTKVAACGVNSNAVGWTPGHWGYGAPTWRVWWMIRHRESCGAVCTAV